MIPGLEVAVGYLARWAWRRARHAAGRVEDRVDKAVDARLEKLYDAVAAKLHGDPALGKLTTEAAQDLDAEPQLSDRTRARVDLALEDAVESDPEFGTRLQELVAEVRRAGGVTASDHGIAAGRDVNVHAESGSVAAVNLHGAVNVGNPPVPGAGQG